MLLAIIGFSGELKYKRVKLQLSAQKNRAPGERQGAQSSLMFAE